MIDLVAMILCVGGFTLLSLGQTRIGFLVSGAGSVFWLLFAFSVCSQALTVQSICFLAASIVGFFRAGKH